MQNIKKTNLSNWLRVIIWVYLTIIFMWVGVHYLLRDTTWWLFIINAFAVYLFIPLPLLILINIALRRKDVWLGTISAIVIGTIIFGKIYSPLKDTSVPDEINLTAMTYNLLGTNSDSDKIVNVVNLANSDVVALQELNPVNAEVIQKELITKYPYQVLDPRDGVDGSGIISRYPITISNEKLQGLWIGTPQVLLLTIKDQSIILLNAHTYATNPGLPSQMESTIKKKRTTSRNNQ